MLHKILGWFSNDLAIDLGTANTLVYVKGKGIICNEPSVVVIKKDNNRRSFVSPRVVIGVPSGITQVEQRAVKDAAQASGAREVYLVGEPIAAAIGVGLPVGEPSGNMIVDIGGGTTDIAVISLDGVVYSKAVRVGGDRMDEALIAYIKRRYNLMIGDRTAEQMKIDIGSACNTGSEQRVMEIKGRDLISGIPKTATVTEVEIREALSEPVNMILDTIKIILENTPPELAADIVDRGIVLAGGGALLHGLDLFIREKTGLPVIVAEDPLTAVARGVGKMLDELDLLKRVAFT